MSDEPKWKPIKTSQILYSSASFHPTAECEECGSKPHAMQGPGVAKQWAKEHAARTGHSVAVTQTTRSLYYAPEPKEQQA